MKKTTKPGRGGAREGAGRPAGEATTARLVRLTDEQWAIAKLICGGYTEGLRILLDRERATSNGPPPDATTDSFA